jgi:WD40 repeat protein
MSSRLCFRSALSPLAWAFLPLLVSGFCLHVERTTWGQESPATLELEGHSGPMMSSLFAGGGQAALTASGDHTVRLWDLKSGTTIQAYESHTGPVFALAISEDQLTFATGAQDNTSRVWRLPPTAPLKQWTTQNPPLGSLIVDPQGLWLITTDSKGNVLRTDLSTDQPTPVKSLTGHKTPVKHLSYRGDSFFYATADEEGKILIWSPYLDTPQGTHLCSGQAFVALEFHPNNQELVTTGEDGVVRFWEGSPVAAGAGVDTGQAVVCQALSPDRNQWFLGLADGRVVSVSPETPGDLKEVVKLPGRPQALVYLGDQPASLAALLDDGRCLTFQRDDPASLEILPLDQGTSLSALTAGPKILTGSPDGLTRIFRMPTPQKILRDAAVQPKQLIASGNGQWIYSWDQDGRIRIWDVANASLKQTIQLPPTTKSIAVHPQDSWLVAGEQDGHVTWWNPANPSQTGRMRLSEQSITSMGFQPTTNSLIVGNQQGVVQRWPLPLAATGDATSDENLKPAWSTTLEPAQPVQAIRVAQSQGNWMLLADQGRRAALFSAEGAPTASIPVPAAPWIDFALTTDSTQLFLLDQQQKLWRCTTANPADLKEVPCSVKPQRFRLSPDGDRVALQEQPNHWVIMEVSSGRIGESYRTPQPVLDAQWIPGDQAKVAWGSQGSIELKPLLVDQIWETGAESVSSLYAPPNTPQIFAASEQGRVSWRNEGDEQNTQSIDLGPHAIRDLEVTSDRQWLAILNAGPEVHILQIADPQTRRQIPLRSDSVDLTLSPDGKILASINAVGIVDLYDLATGTFLESLSAHQQAGRIEFHKDNRSILSSSLDKTINRQSLHLKRWVPLESGSAVTALLTANGSQMVAINSDGILQQFELSAGKKNRDFAEGQPLTGQLVTSADQQRVAVTQQDGFVSVFNLANGELEQTLEVGQPVTHLALSPDHLKVAVVDAENRLTVYGPPNNSNNSSERLAHMQVDVSGATSDLQFAKDNTHLWLTNAQGEIQQWLYASPTQLFQFNHGGPVFDVVLNKSGSLLYTVSSDQTVRGFSLENGQQKFQLRGHSGSVLALDLSDDESVLVTSGSDGTLRVWDAIGGRALKQLTKVTQPFYTLDISPNGQQVAAAGEDRQIYLFNSNTGQIEKILEGHEDFIHSVSFNRAGNRLASYGYAGALRIWEIPSGKLTWTTQVGDVGNDVAYSLDGSQVILSGGDGIGRVIEIPSAAR